jgi:hypothetical protein
MHGDQVSVGQSSPTNYRKFPELHYSACKDQSGGEVGHRTDSGEAPNLPRWKRELTSKLAVQMQLWVATTLDFVLPGW